MITSSGYSQDRTDKWFSNGDLEFIIPNKVEYDYRYTDQPGIHIDEITNSKLAFGISYSYNYAVFKKLSVGVLTGFQVHSRPDLSMLKLGGTIKYFFVDTDKAYVYLNPFVYDFSLNKNQFKRGGNTRIGIGFPISKQESYNINLSVFYEVNDLSLKGSKSLYDTEIPQNIIFRSFGFSIGAKF